MEHYDILIIGGGVAGIAAAKAAGGARVLLAESRPQLGGVLLQCAHHGFGKNKSGIEYAAELTMMGRYTKMKPSTKGRTKNQPALALRASRDAPRRLVFFFATVFCAFTYLHLPLLLNEAVCANVNGLTAKVNNNFKVIIVKNESNILFYFCQVKISL